MERYPAFALQRWLPLVEGARYWYTGTFEGKTDSVALTVVRHPTPRGPIFYFADESQRDDPSPLLSTNMFGLAGYTTTQNEVLTVQAEYFGGFQKESSSYVQTLLRIPLGVGDSIEFRDYERSVRVTIGERESVTVPAGTFPNCTRIEITTNFDQAPASSTVWLAEGVGLVKWRRFTGRVDELVKYQLQQP